MINLEKLVKPNVLELQPYTSARDEYQGREGIFLDANENPYDLAYSRYPDPYQSELKTKIAKWKNINEDSIFLGNGSDEVIDLLIRATCVVGKDRLLSLDPSYGMYKVSAGVNDIPLDLVTLNPDMSVNEAYLFSILNESHKLIFICSPNNPNGQLISETLIIKLLESTNNLVVIDEAYIDFSDSVSWCDRLSEYDNLIVIQTFSKSMGAAGARIGMGFMNPYMVSILNKIKPPYNISSPNQEVAIDRLKQLDKISEMINRIKISRTLLSKELEQLDIVDHVFPSMANFILVRFYNYKQVFSVFLDNKLVVRDRSSNTGCENCLRISIGTELENQKILEVLKSII